MKWGTGPPLQLIYITIMDDKVFEGTETLEIVVTAVAGAADIRDGPPIWMEVAITDPAILGILPTRCGEQTNQPSGMPAPPTDTCSDVRRDDASRASYVCWHHMPDPKVALGTITLYDGHGVAVVYEGNMAGLQAFDEFAEPWFRNGSPDPYLSAAVQNRPNTYGIIRLSKRGSHSLSFSEPVSNLVMPIVSLQSNSLTFDQEFDVLSYGEGYFGYGILTKEVVTIDGQTRFKLVGEGAEPHGTILFRGCFDKITFQNANQEYWHGFTVGLLNRPSGATDPVPVTPSTPQRRRSLRKLLAV